MMATKVRAIDGVSGFLPIPLEAENSHLSANVIRLVSSVDDEHCEGGAGEYFGEKLGLTTDILPPEAEHINTESGYGRWPEMFDRCFDSEVRIGS